MRNYNLSRTARPSWPAGARVLALWPLLALACSVYDDALVEDASNPLGGGSGASTNGGTATTAGGGASSAGGGATSRGGGGSGSTSAGTSSGGSAGEPTTQGGSGGDTSTAGSGGTAAAGTTATAGAGGEPPTEDVVLVDDMEDGDTGIEIKDGRNGYWYSGNDGSAGGSMEPSGGFSMTELATGERSDFAAWLKASNFTVWGAVMGFNWVEQAAAVKAYDASAYCGVRFMGKAAAVTMVRVRIPDGDTHPNGGVCKDPGASGTACYDHFGANAAFTTSWKQFTVKFADVAQLGTGYHPTDGKLKANKLYALEWALPPSGGKTYQIWVDDVELIKCP